MAKETRESVIRYEKSMRDLERAKTREEAAKANRRVVENEKHVSRCRRWT